MATFQRLLAATDFSATAGRAMERAVLLAEEMGASLDFVHVVAPPPLEKLRRLATETPAGTEQHLLDSAREELKKQATAILERHGISGGTHVSAGPLIQELANQVRALSADLMIFGTCGASSMWNFLLGSTSDRFVTRASCPMLIVKRSNGARYKTLLVPVDFSPVSHRTLLSARAIAPEAEIVLLHVFEVPFEGKLNLAGIDKDTINHYRIAARQEAMQKLHELCEAADIPSRQVRLLVIHGNPSHRILEQEKVQGCDLIVMGNHGENMFEKFLLGSVTRHVLAESLCDVLISV